MTMKIEVTPEQFKALKNIYRGDDRHCIRQRAHAIMLLHQEQKTPEAISAILSVSRVTIYNWISRWRHDGIDGLYDFEGRGRKPLFSQDEEVIILQEVEKNPSSIRQAAAEIEKRTGKKAHPETLKKILKMHGKSWKRKRKSPNKKPDPEDYKKGKEEIEELKLLASQGEFDIVYFDESGLSLQPVVPYAWLDRGQHCTLEIPSSHSQRINLLGFLNPVANTLETWQVDGSVDSKTVIEVMDAYCDILTRPTMVILDNASIHVSKKVNAKIQEWETRGLSLYFLPTYSPQLNLIEIVWRFIKYHWIPASAYKSLGQLNKAIDEIISGYGSEYSIKFSFV